MAGLTKILPARLLSAWTWTYQTTWNSAQGTILIYVTLIIGHKGGRISVLYGLYLLYEHYSVHRKKCQGVAWMQGTDLGFLFLFHPFFPHSFYSFGHLVFSNEQSPVIYLCILLFILPRTPVDHSPCFLPQIVAQQLPFVLAAPDSYSLPSTLILSITVIIVNHFSYLTDI
jgi:hypothetical protein